MVIYYSSDRKWIHIDFINKPKEEHDRLIQRQVDETPVPFPFSHSGPHLLWHDLGHLKLRKLYFLGCSLWPAVLLRLFPETSAAPI